jgi:hypothetical protein
LVAKIEKVVFWIAKMKIIARDALTFVWWIYRKKKKLLVYTCENESIKYPIIIIIIL